MPRWETFLVLPSGPPMPTIAALCFSAHAFQAAIPSCCFASRSASGRAFHAVICGFVLLPRNTARNVLVALMRFPFLFTLCYSKRLCNPVGDAQSAEGRRGGLVIPARVAGQVGGMGLGHAFASASRFRKAVSPASDTLTHFGSGEASAS